MLSKKKRAQVLFLMGRKKWRAKWEEKELAPPGAKIVPHVEQKVKHFFLVRLHKNVSGNLCNL